MSGYIAGFTFYTLAIIGVILLAFVVAKKSMLNFNISKKKEFFLDIEHSINIAPRKTVQVVRAGDERFLIALDPERTTFLTKLVVEKGTKCTHESFQSKPYGTNDNTCYKQEENCHCDCENTVITGLTRKPVNEQGLNQVQHDEPVNTSIMRSVLEKINYIKR
ncbi:MAG: flagellar biosynthetic protein FliO [Candidatus Gastranaerophilaceae bacterium]|jgi:flagellar biogenesis protein FliO